MTVGALPAVFPATYALDDCSIVFRTGLNGELAAAADREAIAFEVDDTDPAANAG